MCSSEKRDMAPDLQQGFVFGSSAVRPQTHNLPEDAEPQELPEHCFTEMLDLRRTQLTHVADSVLKNSTLKYLYLEGNHLSSIPDSMFISLPNLLWLDLRNNQIASLPAEIGLHRSLRALLLEGNPISELPPELGNVTSLNGLLLRYCPITFPPPDIVSQGVQGILQYLRSAMAKRPVSMRKSPPECPVVEKLQLSELMGSSMEEQNESGDEDEELQRFRELKDKMILLDKAELDLRARGERNLKSHPPIISRKKPTSKAGVIPELPLLDTHHRKRPEARRQAVVKELKEKQAILEQRRKSQEALRKWPTQAKIKQEKKMSAHKQKKQAEQRKREETDSKAAGEDSSDAQDSSDALHIQISSMSITESEETSSARKPEQRICAHVKKIQERRKNPRGTTTEHMAATEQDVEEIRKLQAWLLEKKRKDREKCFTIFTGDTWPSYIGK